MSNEAETPDPTPHAGYALLLNVEEVNASLPFEFVEGYTLARADKEQVEELRRDLAPFVPQAGGRPRPTPYEWRRVPRDGGGWTYVSREPDDFQYFVINFTGPGEEMREIALAGSLLPGEAELEVGPTYVAYAAIGFSKEMLLPNAPARSPVTNALDLYRFFVTLSYTYGSPSQGLGRLSTDDLALLANLYQQIRAHDEKVVELRQKLYELHVLRSIDPRSRLGLVGYMTIIESLLTH